jgi:hypothetical protein
MRHGEFIRNEEVLKVRLVTPGVDSPCVTRRLTFQLDDNMVAERDANLHNSVREFEKIGDANMPSLHFPLLFPHGELGWQLAIRYQGGTTSHTNNIISRRNLPHTDFRSRPVGTHCSIVLQDYFCEQFPH